MSLASSETCTDDYIISGGRSIELLPDNPFQILETKSELIVARGTLVLKFSNPKIIEQKENLIKRYELVFINEKYFFDLINSEYGVIIWEQYVEGNNKRGFGGRCYSTK